MKRCSLWLMLTLAGCGATAGPAPAVVTATQPDPAVVEPAALRAAIAAGVRPRGANEASFEVDAFVATLVVEELAAGGGGLRLEPAIEGGAQVGYRVAAVAEGSAYARVGLQRDDVIEAIGDVRLDSPGRAAGSLATLQRGASVTVVRGGVGFTLDLRIAGGLAWAELLRARAGSPQGQVPEDRSKVIAGIEEIAPLPEIAEVDPWQAAAERAKSAGGGSPSVRPGGSSGSSRPGISGGSSSGGVRPGGSSPAPSGPAAAMCATAASCTLDRRTFDAAVADPERLSGQVSIAPARGGYKLTRVAPNSAISQLGFRAGDTLISVNGSRLDDDVEALSLYMGLGSASKYVVVYERGGVRATKTIALRG